ncbi:MAG: TatD family nuclease-associated radical SAM protein [Gammaproteobacteria bacterium]|jgi:TatD family-associated radical SAM protein
MQPPTLAYSIGDRLYLNVTDRCTLRCAFCPKHAAQPRVRGYDLSLQSRPERQELIEAMGDPGNYREVVFCGFGEPTLRLKLVLELSDHIRSHHGRVRINTDGLANLVHKRNVLPELGGRVDALSVSMNAHNESVYNRHCRPRLRGSYRAMLEFLREAPRHVAEVTATAIDGLEDVDIDACRRLARSCDVRFRRRVLDVVG